MMQPLASKLGHVSPEVDGSTAGALGSRPYDQNLTPTVRAFQKLGIWGGYLLHHDLTSAKGGKESGTNG